MFLTVPSFCRIEAIPSPGAWVIPSAIDLFARFVCCITAGVVAELIPVVRVIAASLGATGDPESGASADMALRSFGLIA